MTREEIIATITAEAERQRVDPRLALAVAQAENALRPVGTSPAGARGVMQLMPGTAAELGVNPDIPAENIRGGVTYLRQLLGGYRGNIPLTLAGYNAGPGAVQKHGGIPPYPETQKYVSKVMNLMGQPLSSQPRLASEGPWAWLRRAVPPRQAMAAEQSSTPSAQGLAGELFGTPPPVPTRQPLPEPVSDPVRLANELFGSPAARAPEASGNAADLAAELFGSASPPIQEGPAITATPEDRAAYLREAESRGLTPGVAQAELDALLAEGGTPEEVAAAREIIRPPDWKGLGAMGISTAGGAAGTALGTLTAPLTGAVGPIAGELAGSLAARKLNVALGLEPEGLTGDILSVAVPGVIRAAGALRRPLLRHAPGAAGALHQEATERLARLAPEPSGGALPAAQQAVEALVPGRPTTPILQETLEQLRPTAGSTGQRLETVLTELTPSEPSAPIYQALHKTTTPIRPSNIVQTARNILREEAALTGGAAFQERRLQQVAEGLQQAVRTGKGQLPLNTLLAHQQRLGLLIDQASQQRWPEEAGLRRLYKAVYDDIDHAVRQGVEGAADLRRATATANREFALQDIRRMLEPGRPGVTTTVTGEVRLPPGAQLERQLEKKWADDALFAQAFSPAEKLQLRHTLREIRTQEALEGFLDRLKPGHPGIATDVATGTSRLANVVPLKQALEQELASGESGLREALPAPTLETLRGLLGGAEHEQQVQHFLEKFQPGRPGIGIDPITGAAQIENIRPLRIAFEREVTRNPAFTAALSPGRVDALRATFQAAEQEYVQGQFARMLRPGGPGLTIRADNLVEINAGALRKAFEQQLREDAAFAAGVPEPMRRDLRRRLTDLSALPRMPPVAGQQFGSGRTILKASIASGLSAAAGLGPAGTMMTTGAVLGVPVLISRALMSPTGRAWLTRELAREGNKLHPALLGLGSQELRESIIGEAPTATAEPIVPTL